MPHHSANSGTSSQSVFNLPNNLKNTTTMYKLLPVLAVFAYGACVLAGAALVQRDYGVKLCGREFIRAVIFTCGGSRWRRAGDKHLERQSDEIDPYLLSSYQNPSDGEPDWSQSKSLAPEKQPSFLSSSSPSLSDLIQAMEERTRSAEDTDTSEELRGWQLQSWLDTLYSSRPQGATRFRSLDSRKKRNFSLGLAGMCCNQGCTKNDIGRLC